MLPYTTLLWFYALASPMSCIFKFFETVIKQIITPPIIDKHINLVSLYYLPLKFSLFSIVQ